MKAVIDVVSILAVGINKRYMTYLTEKGKTKTIFITDDLYQQLKKQNIPTGQKLRWNKK